MRRRPESSDPRSVPSLTMWRWISPVTRAEGFLTEGEARAGWILNLDSDLDDLHSRDAEVGSRSLGVALIKA